MSGPFRWHWLGLSLILGTLLMASCGAPNSDPNQDPSGEDVVEDTIEEDAAEDEASYDLLPCVYQAAGPDGEMASRDACAHVDAAGRLTVEPPHLDAMDFGQDLGDDALASLFVDGSWFYVRRDGPSLRVLSYDNGPDPWQDGLTRGLREGRMVYFDRSLRPAIDLELDWGWPFEDGLALVCRGCRLDGHEGAEHRALVGGQWGYIDLNGTIQVPITGTREQAYAERQAL